MFLKRILVLLISVNFLTQFNIIVLAQEASQSAVIVEEATPTPTIEASPSATLTPEPTLNPTVTPEITPSVTVTPSPLPLEPSPVVNNSATLLPTPKVRPLTKKDFQANETINLTLENTDSSEIKMSLKNNKGDEVPVLFEEETINQISTLKINPLTNLKPGKYILTIVDRNGQVTEQEFTWGVLAINPNKSVYLPGETAKIAMAVLDNQGKMVCNANLELRIQNSELGVDDLLSTENGKIIVNPDCVIYDVTAKPDYEAHYQFGSSGQYTLTFNAQTKDGSYTVTDSIKVQDNVSFDIERVGPTRIYVPKKYKMNFNIKFNQDFEGEIIETVPESFTTYSDEKFPYENVKIVNTDKGKSSSSTINLNYPFVGSPLISQQFGDEETNLLLKEKYDKYGVIGHDGVDFDMPEGTPILSVDEGEVALAEDWDYGLTLVVRHSWGQSYYGHLSEFKVVVGQKVSKGEEIGLSGQTGLATGPHLHFGIKLKNHNIENGYFGKVDPLPFLGEKVEISSFSVKQINWKVNAKSGDVLSFGYDFIAPSTSPEFYLLGPLIIKQSNNEIIFSESRQWQIAADSTSILYADGDISTTDWIIGTCISNLWDCINEGTVSYNDSDYLKTTKGALGGSTYSYTHTATDSLADTATVTQIDFSVRAYYSGVASTLDIYYSTDGSDPTTKVGTTITLTTSATTYTRTASSLSLTKTQIDALRVKFTGNVAKNGYVYVSASEYDITYTPVVTGPTLDQLMRHGQWFNSSGVRQPFTF